MRGLLIMIKVSIIVPVYNTEKYLKKCLDSLVNQTLKDIEIICINDGSLDNSLQILKEYEKKDNRIKIVNQRNQGVSIARNNGIKLASGEYIGFTDSDDYVDLDFYEKLYNGANNQDMCGGEIKKSNYQYRKYYCFWSYIYKKSLIINNNIIFPEKITNGEDVCFLWKAIFLSNKINYVNNTYYHYIKRNGSAVNSKMTLEKINSILESIKFRFELVNQYINNIEEYNDFLNTIIYEIFTIITKNNLDTDILESIFYFIKYINNRSKFKINYKQNINKEVFECENFEDFLYLCNRNITIFLFNFIPILKIKKLLLIKRFYLFNFINILIIKNKHNKIYYKLFGFLPIFKEIRE